MDLSNLPTVNIEFFGPVNMYLALGIETLTALTLGAAIGINREMKLKTAGFKTHILICLGATFYTAIGLLNLSFMGGAPADPNRIAAQVVSGIGFLGAGAIMRSGGSIQGLTTAAGIWTVAAVGVAIGSGYPFSAILFTLTVLLVLVVLDPLYRFLRPQSNVLLEVIGQRGCGREVIDFVESRSVHIHNLEVLKNEDKTSIHFYLKSSLRELRELVQRLKHIEEIERIDFRIISELPKIEGEDE